MEKKTASVLLVWDEYRQKDLQWDRVMEQSVYAFPKQSQPVEAQLANTDTIYTRNRRKIIIVSKWESLDAFF